MIQVDKKTYFTLCVSVATMLIHFVELNWSPHIGFVIIHIQNHRAHRDYIHRDYRHGDDEQPRGANHVLHQQQLQLWDREPGVLVVVVVAHNHMDDEGQGWGEPELPVQGSHCWYWRHTTGWAPNRWIGTSFSCWRFVLFPTKGKQRATTIQLSSVDGISPPTEYRQFSVCTQFWFISMYDLYNLLNDTTLNINT